MSDRTFVEDALRSTAAGLFDGSGRSPSVAELIDLGWSELAADDPRLTHDQFTRR